MSPETNVKSSPEFEYETYKIGMNYSFIFFASLIFLSVVGLVGTPMSFEEFISRQKQANNLS